ncbi:MAG: hypothetical protein IJ576_08205 [Synergistaceae bacterium]|nr:hypothetical protein [Synergistaceae bacterium]MBR1604380.1 hypothetical protein [Synergistaceae bacterium]
MLEYQRKEAERQVEIFTDNRALADLAYNVEQNALGMIELVHSGFLHFDSLKTIVMPQLQIFDDGAPNKNIFCIHTCHFIHTP